MRKPKRRMLRNEGIDLAQRVVRAIVANRVDDLRQLALERVRGIAPRCALRGAHAQRSDRGNGRILPFLGSARTHHRTGTPAPAFARCDGRLARSVARRAECADERERREQQNRQAQRSQAAAHLETTSSRMRQSSPTRTISSVFRVRP